MKKLILSLVAIATFGFANAQEAKESSEGFSKGDLFVSGGIGLSSAKTGDFKENNSTFSPRVAYFVDNNIAIGLALGFSTQKLDVGGDSVKNSQTALGVFGRYYVTPSSRFSLFAQLGIDMVNSDFEFIEDVNGEFFPADAETKGFNVALSPGLHYFVNDKFALETTVGVLGYSSDDNGGNGADKTNTFGLGLDFSNVMFGLTYKF